MSVHPIRTDAPPAAPAPSDRTGGRLTGEEQALADFALRHDLVYLPRGRADELPLDLVPGGEPVLVRGLGPAFLELVMPLTAGRGGRFTWGVTGEPVYLPSGREPLLYVGSRRGVPHHPRPGYRLAGTDAAGPRFFTAQALPDGPLDLRRTLWPLLEKELAFAYYRELLTAHPERTRMDWAELEAAFATEEWGGTAMRALIRRAVPKHADRLNLDRLDRPLHGIRFGDLAGLQRWMHGYMAADLARRSDPEHSADLAMIHRLLAVYRVVAELPAERVAADPWFHGFCGFLAGGATCSRYAMLLALARAGVVTFLGAGLRVEPADSGRGWRATSRTVPESVEARALIEARPPLPAVDRPAVPMLAGLWRRLDAAA